MVNFDKNVRVAEKVLGEPDFEGGRLNRGFPKDEEAMGWLTGIIPSVSWSDSMKNLV